MLSKGILVNNIKENNEEKWLLHKDISEYLEIEKVCLYPDNSRKLILEKSKIV